MTTAFALHCRVCEDVGPPEPVEVCRRCEGPTDITYDWDRLRGAAGHELLAVAADSLWRYRDFLPAGRSVDFAAGGTPLVRSERLSELLDVDVLLKLETANPTRSFKDRLAAVAAAAALDYGMTTLCCSSTGNLGDAVAAAGSAAGLETFVLAPAGRVSGSFRGKHLLVVDGTYDDCRRLEAELGVLFPWGFVSGNLRPYATEGAKTIAFEIAEQLEWMLPDAVFCAAASGTLASKVVQGFIELRRAGLCDGRLPAMFAAQAAGASPIAAAFADNREISRVLPQTDFHSLAVGDPAYGDLAIAAARATGGSVTAVADAEVPGYRELLARTTGVLADCAAGVALGALLQAVRERQLEPGSQVVLVVTGAALEEQSDADVEVVDANVESVLTRLGVGLS